MSKEIIMVKVSVIVPVYNVEEYIAECLDSIINQSLDDIEIICVDDCSTDNSLELLYEYEKKDNRIIVLRHDTNKGLGASRNTGMKYASGEYIGFIDSDDFVDKDMYLKLYDKSSRLNLDLLFFKIAIFDNETGELDFNHPYFSLKKFDNFNKDVFTHEDTKNFTCDLCVSACSTFFKRKYLMDNGFSFNEGMIFEDEPFFYNVYLNANRVSLLKESFYFYRRNRQGSIMHKKDSTYMDVVKAFQFVRQAFIDSNNFTQEYRKILYHRFFYVVLNRFSLVSDLNVREEFFLRIKEDFKSIIQSQNDFQLLSEGFQKKTLNVLFSNSYREFEEYENNNCVQQHSGIDIGDKYKISIILPIHNMEKYIHKAMESIINQSFGFSNIEVLLVDDKSTDDTPNIMKYYSDKYKNVKSIYLKENSGFAGKPRNVGIDYSTCDYVMFLDPDDYYEENACEILYNEIYTQDLDLVSGNYSDVEFNANNKYNWKQKFGLDGYRFRVNSITENDKLLDINPSIWVKIYRKDFLIKNNIKFPENLPGQDLYFNFVSLFKAKGISFIDEPILRYIARNNEGDLSVSCNNSKDVLIGLLEVYNRIFVFLENFNSNYSWFVLKQFRYYWIGRFIDGNLSFDEMKEVVDKASFLFNKYLESNNIRPMIHKNLFYLIADKDYLGIYNELSEINKNYLKRYLLSVIVLVDNSGNNIKSLFNSIKLQSIGFNNLEIIFVYGGSKDNSKSIIQELTSTNNNVSAIFLEDYNFSEMCNEAILSVSSDYFMFLNQTILKNVEICEILFDAAIKYDSDIVIGECVEWNNSFNFEYNSLSLNIFSIYSKLFKQDYICSNNLKFEKNAFCEELFVKNCLFNSTNLKYINNPMFNVNLSNKNLNQFNVNRMDANMKYIRGYDKNRYLSTIGNNCSDSKNDNESALNKFKSYF